MPSEYPSADEHRRAPAVNRGLHGATDAREFRKRIATDPDLKRFAALNAKLNTEPMNTQEANGPEPSGVAMLSRGAPEPASNQEGRSGIDTALDFISSLSPAFVSLAQTGIENALEGRDPIEAFQYLRDQTETSPFDPIDKGMPVTDCLSSLMAQHARYIAIIGLMVAIDQNGAEW